MNMKTKQLFPPFLWFIAVFGSVSWARAEQTLTVVSFGGSYARACVEGYHKAFTEETGIRIKLEDYNGGLAQIRAQVDARVGPLGRRRYGERPIADGMR